MLPSISSSQFLHICRLKISDYIFPFHFKLTVQFEVFQAVGSFWGILEIGLFFFRSTKMPQIGIAYTFKGPSKNLDSGEKRPIGIVYFSQYYNRFLFDSNTLRYV